MSRWNIWDEYATPDMVPGIHGEHDNPLRILLVGCNCNNVALLDHNPWALFHIAKGMSLELKV